MNIPPILQTLLWLLALIGLSLLAAIAWSQFHTPSLGMHHGQLMPCPASPNCVCSEEGHDASHHIEPLAIADDEAVEKAWLRFAKLLSDMPGSHIDERTRSDIYIHATVETPVLHFVDDVEARLDLQRRVIHWRSASRVGHADFGVNRHRLEQLRQQWR